MSQGATYNFCKGILLLIDFSRNKLGGGGWCERGLLTVTDLPYISATQ